MTAKRIVILKGSPRPNGNSTALADQAALGAQGTGATVQAFELRSMQIASCNACNACQNTKEGCIIEDDMRQIYAAVRAADVIVFASPVYWFNFSAQIKLVIDRLFAVCDDDWKLLGSKQFAVLLTYGDADLYVSGGINAIRSIEDMARYLNAPCPECFYASANDEGEVLKNTGLIERAKEFGRKLAAMGR